MEFHLGNTLPRACRRSLLHLSERADLFLRPGFYLTVYCYSTYRTSVLSRENRRYSTRNGMTLLSAFLPFFGSLVPLLSQQYAVAARHSMGPGRGNPRGRVAKSLASNSSHPINIFFLKNSSRLLEVAGPRNFGRKMVSAK